MYDHDKHGTMVSAWYQFGTVDGQNIIIRLTLHYLSLVVYPTIHGFYICIYLQTRFPNQGFLPTRPVLRYNLLLLPPSASMTPKTASLLFSQKKMHKNWWKISAAIWGLLVCLFPFPARFEMSQVFFF